MAPRRRSKWKTFQETSKYSVLVLMVLAAFAVPAVGHNDCNKKGVAVATNQDLYASGEEVIVSVHNGLEVSIFGLTGHTYCTIVSLERKNDGAWQEQGKCLAGAPPGWVEIPAGACHTVALAPRLFEDRPLPEGRYRAAFWFKLESTSGADAVAYAPEFFVVAQSP